MGSAIGGLVGGVIVLGVANRILTDAEKRRRKKKKDNNHSSLWGI